MAEIVNLRRARKRRAREESGNKADASAFKHGEGKAERRLREARAALDERRLAGHRRDAQEVGTERGGTKEGGTNEEQ